MRRVMQFVEQADGTHKMEYFNRDRDIDTNGAIVKQSDFTPYDNDDNDDIDNDND